MRFFQALLFSIAIGTMSASAAPIMEIDDSHQSYIAGRYMDFLEDKVGGLTFEEVNQPPWSGRFQPLGRDIAVFSFSRSAFWMRLTMINKTSTAQDLILHQYTSWIDSFDIYITGVDGKTETRKSGERYPFGQREIEHNHLLFRLALAPGESIRITMRTQSQDPLQLPITIWKEAAFDGYNARLNMYFGVVFGSLLVVFFYNMMLYVSLRDIVYLHYILYIFSLIFMIFIYTGYAYQYLWPDNPALQSQMVFPSGYLAMFLAIFIAKSFLDTARNMPRIHMAITIFQAMCLALPLYGFIADDYLFTSLTCSVAALIFPILMGFAGVVAYLAQVRAARFFILAWASSLIGQLVSMGTLFGLFPPDEIYRRMMEVGFMADAVFLSFALADRVRILRQEKEQAEMVAINALEASKDELERKVAQRTAELSSEKERAEAATRLKDKFVALVSHDLRSPLGSIITMLGQLKPEREGDKNIEINKKMVSMTVRTAHGMMEMIDNLLDLSRLRTGAIALSKKRLNAHLMTENLIHKIMPRAEEKGITIENLLPAEFTIVADPDLFDEVILNLLANAVKFCNSGDHISVINPDGAPGAMAVKDTGIGIPADLIGNIFHHQTSRSGTDGEKGTGLGLPYCHDIMEAHGGSIQVESTPGQGSVFTLRLPLV